MNPLSRLLLKQQSLFSCGDADANAFILAAGITNNTEKTAICTLVTDLKTASLWSKFHAIYPFVGSSSSSCSYNLKNPAAFQITFVGSSTFNTNGFTPDGSTGYGNTGYVPSAQMVEYDTHLSVFDQNDTVGSKFEIGFYDGSSSIIEIVPRYIGDTFYTRAYTILGGVIAASSGDSRGLWLSSITSSSSLINYRNGSIFTTSIAPTAGLAGLSGALFIGALNVSGSGFGFSDRTQIITTIGSGLTGGEAATMYTIFNAFKTTLGR